MTANAAWANRSRIGNTLIDPLRSLQALNWRFLAFGMALTGVSGCGPSYSPDTYASNAVQQANKVEQGIIIGVRPVAVTASGTVGTASGAAAGGIAGSQIGIGPVSAITALGGSLVGGFAGSAAEHISADTAAFEYIVRKPNGDLVSVTQKDRVPLALGQQVLVIAGTQARVVPDYTLPPDISAAKSDKPRAARPVEAVRPAEPVKPDPPAPDSKPDDTTAPDSKPNDATAPDAAAGPPAADPKSPDSATPAANPKSPDSATPAADPKSPESATPATAPQGTEAKGGNQPAPAQ